MNLIPYIILIVLQLTFLCLDINTIKIEYTNVYIKNYIEKVDNTNYSKDLIPPIIEDKPKEEPKEEKKEDSNEHKDINLSEVDNTEINWWFGRNENIQRPKGAMDIEKLKGYGGYYIGKDDKTIYLTFDEGGNNITYVKEIVNILNANNVKATFFFTENYILANSELVKYIVDSGHIVGNHSVTHQDFTKLTIEEMKAELLEVEKAYLSVTGKEMTKVFRFPMGAFSERTISLLNEMGYRTYFWSFAYRDWEEDLATEVSLSWFEKYYHNGAIYLIHPKNKGNYLALETFIKDMKEKGYTFDLVTNIK